MNREGLKMLLTSDPDYVANLIRSVESRRRFNKDHAWPECYSDIATFENNKKLAKNPCVKCLRQPNCIAAFKQDYDYIQAQVLACFGSPVINLLAAAPMTCRACKIRDKCSEVVISRSPVPLSSAPVMSSAAAEAPVAPKSAAIVTTGVEKASGDVTVAASAPSKTTGVGSTAPAIPASAPRSVPASGTGPYKFPFEDPALQRMFENMKATPTERLVEALRQLSYGKVGGSGEYVPYAKVRLMICAIGLLLNEKGETAPRFRLVRKETKFTTRDKKDSSNDLQVLDLHWLSLHAKVDLEQKWNKLFHGGINFNVASRFVEQVGSGENKVTALGITEATQFMLSVIQTKKVAERWNTIKARADKAVAGMREIADKARSRLNPADIPARRNDYVALSIARGNPTTAAEILPRIAGAPSSRTTMRKRKSLFIEIKLPAE